MIRQGPEAALEPNGPSATGGPSETRLVDEPGGSQVWHGRLGRLLVEPLADGRLRLRAEPEGDRVMSHRDWVTSYPLQLVRDIFDVKDLWVVDEIKRDEDPRYVEQYLRQFVLRYVPAEQFAGKRVLDFGCGSGASSLVLSRLLPDCEIVGVELEARLLNLARRRIAALGKRAVQLHLSPSGDKLPADLGQFDYIMFNAVYEHLLPHERRQLLPLVWSHLRPGGVLFLNQTPYRYSPVEIHTTAGMPLINYMPDAMALWTIKRFSRRFDPDVTWEALLRMGIRGATVPEILGVLGNDAGAELMAPVPAGTDRIDVWFDTLSTRYGGLKRTIRGSLKVFKALTGREITPSLALAIRRRH
jgi:2-polyprenyl-3-methyl-5-hydroxy-6-metoxy-1,4-benzoquinol methylase